MTPARVDLLVLTGLQATRGRRGAVLAQTGERVYAGNSVDLSHAIMDRGMLHSDGTSHLPNVRIRGRLCRTNQASNTAFRGFGGPQGMLVADTWLAHLGHELGLPFEAMQERNMYREGQRTHFGQALEHNRLGKCWAAAKRLSAWGERRAATDAFNAQSRHAATVRRAALVLPKARELDCRW